MVNLAKDHRRSLRRYQGALVKLSAEVGAVTDGYPSDLDELLRLPSRTRAVLYMKEVEGRSFMEIAQVVGCSETAARKAASRGRRHLRGVLSEEVHDATA
jgi:DNA-directed RNA polymerase specialized sigma24 family protein